jgi:predicted lipid carrier protein YhbT
MGLPEGVHQATPALALSRTWSISVTLGSVELLRVAQDSVSMRCKFFHLLGSVGPAAESDNIFMQLRVIVVADVGLGHAAA